MVPKIDMLREFVPFTPSTTLLDVGCGNGFFTYYFDQMVTVEGIDSSHKMLEMNPVANTHLMDASDMSFADDSFDIVFCHALLHHVEDLRAVVREMRRVSRRYVIILEPNRNNPLVFLFHLLVRRENTALKFSLSYLKHEAETCGLNVVEAFSHGMIVPNKTPEVLLNLMKEINGRQPLGMTNFIIAEKR